MQYLAPASQNSEKNDFHGQSNLRADLVTKKNTGQDYQESSNQKFLNTDGPATCLVYI